MAGKKTRVVVPAVFALAMVLVARLAFGTGQPEFELAVDAPRPVAAAIEVLERRHAWVITYEDPRYVHEADLLDVTSQSPPAAANRSGVRPRMLIPAGGRLSFFYAPPPTEDAAEGIIGQLLDAHAGLGHSRTFDLLRTSEMWHVVPVRVRGADGRFADQRSILDQTIRLTDRRRTVMETLQAICDALASATSTPVVVGVVPGWLMRVDDVTRGEPAGQAREILIRTLGAVGPGFSWTLMFDPTLHWYGLNVHLVPGR